MPPTNKWQYWTPLSSAVRKRLLKFAGKVISRPHRKTYGLNEVQKIHQGKQFVRSDPFCFIKLSCLRFLWLGPSVRFATKWHGKCDKFTSFVRFNAWCKRNMQIEIHDTVHPHPEDLPCNHETFKNCMNKWCLQPRYPLRGWVCRTTYLHQTIKVAIGCRFFQDHH